MKDFNFKSGAAMSSLAVLLIAAASSNGCGTGSDTPSGAAGTSGGAGTGAQTTGGAGTGAQTTGTAGTGSNTTGTAGTGSNTTGAAGTGSVTVLPPATGVCKDAGTRSLTIADGKIDNFEDATLSPGWSTFNDVLVGTEKNTIKMILSAGGALATGHYGHYSGMGAKLPKDGGYGVGAIYNAAIDKTGGIYCVDVTAFDGLTFWAKAGKAGSKVGVNFVVPETNAVADGGDCAASCYNHPQKSVTLTTEWAQYNVLFSQAIAGANKVNGRVQMIGFLSPDADWDFSVDEIQFYKGTAPTTPIPAN